MSAFYAHQARSGAGAGDLLAAWRTGGRGGWKPFLHHISKGGLYRGRAIALKAPKRLPRVLTAAEMQAILDACTRLRDRFFFAVLHETGFRGLDWREARLEDVGEFVVWLQLPPAGRAGEVAVLPSVTAEVTASTVNRKLR